jgi:hypothetical protein
MIKKILYIIVLTILCINIGYGVEYLNSCGKSSGWISGETYIINFTEIPNTYLNNYCFLFNSEIDSINFIQGTEYIEIKTLGDISFFLSSINFDIIDSSFENFNIYNTKNEIIFLDLKSGSDLLYNNFNNITIKNLNNSDYNYFLYHYFLIQGSSGATNIINLSNNNFNNIWAENTHFIDLRSIDQSILASNRKHTMTFSDNEIENVFAKLPPSFENTLSYGFISMQMTGRLVGGSEIYINVINNTMNNIVSTTQNDNPLKINFPSSIYAIKDISNNSVTNSIFKNKLFEDANNDGMGDSGEVWQYNILFPSPLIYLKLRDVTFIQDMKEGFDFNFANEKIYAISDINLTTNDVITGTNTNNEIDGGNSFTTFQSAFSIDLGTGNTINCNMLSFLDYCSFNDNGYSSILGISYRGLITLNSNNKIIGTYFSKNDGQNNAHIISNSVDVTRNNLEILDNIFIKQDSRGKDGDEHLMKLKYTNLDIHDNTFTTGGLAGTEYELLSIDSVNAVSNEIYNNEFTSTLSGFKVGEIFTENCDTLFYGNSIDSYYNITNGCTGELNVTPLVPYLHTDGKVYYFYVGNYYEDNAGCTDANGDGFCDNPYTSGSVTDTRPLVSYPFDYTASLLFYDDIVDNTSFDITLYGVTDNETIELSGITDTLQIGFSHNSDFPDLVCDYIIDGVPIGSETIVNPEKNIIYNITITGLTEKSYAYRVECGNDFSYILSDEITFTITYTDDGGGGDDGDDDGDGGTGDSETFDGFNLFTGDAESDGQNTLQLFELMGKPLTYAVMIGFLILFVGLVFLLFSVVALFIPKR